ncbi:unnamed protein product [Prunus armeniaca]|uniref:Uncharacterized protein n=1 Tax=Prunus armeniaca TaxID=36596 RepID=A0A6J5TIJ9_PRUAR|nr:unnamed protein product [Prunus armeniaca]
MVYIKVGSLKVFYKVHAEDVVKEILDDRCIANLVGTIPSNRVVVLYFHDPTDQNTLDSKKEEVWPSLDSDEYANVAKEEHVQVEFDGNEADNEEEMWKLNLLVVNLKMKRKMWKLNMVVVNLKMKRKMSKLNMVVVNMNSITILKTQKYILFRGCT